VLDRRRRLGLRDEPRAEVRLVGQRRRDDLQRHDAVEPELRRAVHDTHAAAPGEPLDAVVDEDVARRELGHVRPTSSGLWCIPRFASQGSAPMTKTLYTARATADGGRTGRTRTDDGALDVTLVIPRELGGDGSEGTNPEQLFAVGYSSCFLSALKLVSGKREVPADDARVTAAVSLHPDGRGFKLSVGLDVTMPGVDAETAAKMVSTAHQVCPYSNATRDNIDVTLTLEGEPVH
jgi:Ohr subfamily peroxiredoxin